MEDREFVPVAVRNDYGGFDGADLIAHAQWCFDWVTTYSKHSENTYSWSTGISCHETGCCGPNGAIKCACGAEIGMVFADCIHDPPTMIFYDKKIQRSDQCDGPWIINDNRLEQWGTFIDGRRHGEWESFQPGSYGQQLVKIEQWENGILSGVVEYDSTAPE